jgi:hypothetical protein
MIQIMRDEQKTPETRLEAAKSAAPYYPPSPAFHGVDRGGRTAGRGDAHGAPRFTRRRALATAAPVFSPDAAAVDFESVPRWLGVEERRLHEPGNPPRDYVQMEAAAASGRCRFPWRAIYGPKIWPSAPELGGSLLSSSHDQQQGMGLRKETRQRRGGLLV